MNLVKQDLIRFVRFHAILLLLGCLTFKSFAHNPNIIYEMPPYEDSIPKDGVDRYVKDLILPGSLIVLGTAGVWSLPFLDLNESVKEGMKKLRGDHYFRIDDGVQYMPFAAYLAMGALGVKCKHPFRERFMAGATAYVVLGAIVNSVKYTVCKMRPDNSARNSFPSGHTATVFMGAELIRQEYGLGLSIGAYTAAVGVAFLRLYNNRHWLNDVIAGAGVGILSARIGYWMLPIYRKWFHWNKSGAFSIVPNYNI